MLNAKVLMQLILLGTELARLFLEKQLKCIHLGGRHLFVVYALIVERGGLKGGGDL